MKTENKIDNRSLSIGEKNQLRRSIVTMHQKGIKGNKIVDMLGVNKTTVVTVLKLYKAGGLSAIRIRKAGRKPGDQRRLDSEQEKAIQKMIIDKLPGQLKLDFALWTREAVTQLIERQFGFRLPIRTVGDYLNRWGFTPQKPIKRAYEQQPEAVKKWLDEQYPAIHQQAKTEQAEIHWADQTALQNTDVRARGYAPKGQTPLLKVPAKREHLSMMSSVTNKGKLAWMIIENGFNAQKLIEFMQLLIKDNPSKVFLILDNLRVHHSKLVKEWAEENKDRISLFYLPSYSPELNPDERLNADLKQEVRKKQPVRTKIKLQNQTETHMEMLQNNPQKVKAFFGDKFVKYAA